MVGDAGRRLAGGGALDPAEHRHEPRVSGAKPDHLHDVRRHPGHAGAGRVEFLAQNVTTADFGDPVFKASTLREVNERLWQIEDDVRLCERGQDFGPRFVELARSVYRENDQRSALKRAVNELFGSRLIEEKSYPEYPSC